MITRPSLVIAALAVAISGCSGCSGGNGDTPPPPPPPTKPGHVFVLVLENENYDTSFGPASTAPYLSQTLPAMGQLLTNYYGTGHLSQDNYISMVSGQGPNADTQGDCQFYTEFLGVPVLDGSGQIAGQGCVYPAIVKHIGDQLDGAGLSWRAYMEDMGNDPAVDNPGRPTVKTCGHPSANTRDGTQSARATDQYAARHNPFVYFHTTVDDTGYCDQHVVPLDDTTLTADLATIATTPNYVFITPDLCHDGHDAVCADATQPGGLAGIDEFLQLWIPKIVNSPAFQHDGMLIVTFDEAEAPPTSGSDTTDCSTPADTEAPRRAGVTCAEPIGPNSPSPGITGPGGGRIGAVVISRFTIPGTVNGTPYNLYSMLRSIEDIFGLPYLGFAGDAGTPGFAEDVYNKTSP
jgi:hypothetical protein